MDEEYDVLVCGTGLKECILSGLLSLEGKKVLHVDRNNYYGGESASLNLVNLFEKFKGKEEPVPKKLGASREWNVDLIPKFVMSNGTLVKLLIKSKVSKYLEWLVVEGTFVYQFQKAALGGFFGSDKHIHKVPTTDVEVLKSPLMSIMEKNRCKNFFQYCVKYDPEDKTSWGEFDLSKDSMRKVYAHYGLGKSTIEFIGHAVALHPDEAYIDKPAIHTMDKIHLYIFSLAKHGSSPFVYPVYGLGGLPEGFSRLAAVHGSVYMLNTDISEFVYGENGRVIGAKGPEGEIIKCHTIVCDPSYMNKKSVKSDKKIVRCVTILNNPPAEANGKTSCQIIIPQSQADRVHDIYVTVISHQHGVCPQGYYIAVIATVVETDDPEKEIAVALKLLGEPEYKFMNITDYYVPSNTSEKDGVYCTESYDATSHFQTCSDDVLSLYKSIVGKDLDLDISDITRDDED